MLEAMARVAITGPRRILAAAVLFMIAAAVVGVPVGRSLSTGGFQDPTSESSSASQVLTDKFAAGDMRLILAVHADGGVDSPAARTAGGRLTAMLEHSPYVTTVTSAWTVPAAAMTALISKDGNTGLVIAGIGGGETSAQEHARQLVEALPLVEGVTVKAGGEAMANVQMVEQSRKDMVVLEMIAVPVSLIILLWVFGGVVAALLPVAVGLFAILGSMAVLRLVTMATEVSVFALNLVSALGLALAIDYTLLIVSRFRDEVSAGALPRDALTRTMTTAGRTVLFSATTVALSMVAMVMFPMPFLKSLAYAGIAVVVFAAAAALVLTPALIVVTGERLNSYDLRKFVRRAVGWSEPAARPVEQTFWYRWAKGAMRHAIPVSIGIVAVLLLLGAPFLGVKWGHPDDRVLPPTSSARQVGDELRSQFSVNSLTQVTVVLPDTGNITPDQLGLYAAALKPHPRRTLDAVNVHARRQDCTVNEFRSGFVCFVGRPNTGKSTLTNALVGSKVAITSNRPQTTRHTIRGIVHREEFQIVLVDTPGLHRPRTLLGKRLNELVRATYSEVDVIGLCIPADETIGPGDRWIYEQIRAVAPRTTLVVIVTKIDKVTKEKVAEQLIAVHELVGDTAAEIVPVSATKGEQVDVLIDVLAAQLPPGPAFYPDGELTDEPEEVLMAELIREAALEGVRDELPHSLAVVIEEIEPREGRSRTGT